MNEQPWPSYCTKVGCDMNDPSKRLRIMNPVIRGKQRR